MQDYPDSVNTVGYDVPVTLSESPQSSIREALEEGGSVAAVLFITFLGSCLVLNVLGFWVSAIAKTLKGGDNK